MSAISKVLVQQTRLDIFKCDRPIGIDMKGWIANQNYHIDSDLTTSNYSIRAHDKGYLQSALANDCNRMAMAAIESISGLQLDRTLTRSGAWGVIRAYYAAFFAMHSILRMYGISCSQLDQAHVDKIFESATLANKSGGVSRLDKGFYAIKIDSNFLNVSFQKYKDSHKDTWGEFLKLIDSLISESAQVTAISKYKLEAVDILRAVRHGITRSKCGQSGNWLSIMRNSVNYQHSHGVWFPYERKSAVPNYIQATAKQWNSSISNLDLGLSGGDIKVFFELITLINSFFRELLVSCSEKAGNNNPIFRNGSLKLINSLR